VIMKMKKYNIFLYVAIGFLLFEALSTVVLIRELNLIRITNSIVIIFLFIGLAKRIEVARLVTVFCFILQLILLLVGLGMSILSNKIVPLFMPVILILGKSYTICVLIWDPVRRLFPTTSFKNKLFCATGYLILMIGSAFLQVEVNRWNIRTEAVSMLNEIEIHFQNGNRLFDEKKYDDAMKEFEAILRINPNFTPARQNISICQKRLVENSDDFCLRQYTDAFNEGDFLEARRILNGMTNLTLKHRLLTDLEKAEKGSSRQKGVRKGLADEF